MSRKTQIGCVAVAGLALAALIVPLLVAGRGRWRARVASPPAPSGPHIVSQVPSASASQEPAVRTPPSPTGPLEVDEEAVGFVSEAGYDYPDPNVGKIACPAPKSNVRVYAIARAPERFGGSWTFVSSTHCPRPSWVSSVSWPQGTPQTLPTITDLPSLRWPDAAALPKVEKAVGAVEASIGDSIEGRAEPGRAGLPSCVLPKGSEVHALAQVSKESLDVVVRSPSCKAPVWIWLTDVVWKGHEWWDLHDKLPNVRATLDGPLRAPAIVGGAQTTPAVAPPANSSAPSRVYVQDTKGHEHPWHRAIPEAWRASRPDLATLVATVKRTPEMIERCSYLPMGVVYRVRPGYSITLSLNDRSRVVARTTLRGEAPAACPGSVSVSIGGGGGTDPWQIGGEPDLERVASWLQPFALGPR